ncbi:MAG: YigZ family protein [Clostridia bacterium]|nr:YigZ family protein [Clostridia bacterium]MBQ8512414.1 YigZ family protein [Clostridia bacterium]
MKKKDVKAAPEEVKRRITLASEVSVEMEERKSLFIGHAKPVSSEEEARAFIDAKKKEYHDATHNVYAYLLNGGAVARYSDDGEPQGTAGMPVLNVVKLSGATDLCVVVTRYFGGILLGAGGLVRAYSASAKQAVDAAGLAVFEDYAVMQLKVSYSDYQKLTVALEKLGASEDSCDFGEDVSVLTAIEKTREDEIRQTVAELTYGKGQVTVIGYEERASRVKNG